MNAFETAQVTSRLGEAFPIIAQETDDKIEVFAFLDGYPLPIEQIVMRIIDVCMNTPLDSKNPEAVEDLWRRLDLVPLSPQDISEKVAQILDIKDHDNIDIASIVERIEENYADALSDILPAQAAYAALDGASWHC